MRKLSLITFIPALTNLVNISLLSDAVLSYIQFLFYSLLRFLAYRHYHPFPSQFIIHVYYSPSKKHLRDF